VKHICPGLSGPAAALGQNIEKLLFFERLQLVVIIQLDIVKPKDRMRLRRAVGAGPVSLHERLARHQERFRMGLFRPLARWSRADR
jgi:hypothetical protein